MMTDDKGETYEERLRDTGLELLMERRKTGEIIEAVREGKVREGEGR